MYHTVQSPVHTNESLLHAYSLVCLHQPSYLESVQGKPSPKKPLGITGAGALPHSTTSIYLKLMTNINQTLSNDANATSNCTAETAIFHF